MVKVYVELVWDIHFPGKLTRGEEKGGKENRTKEKAVSTETKATKQHCKKHCTQQSGEKIGHDHSLSPKQKHRHTLAP